MQSFAVQIGIKTTQNGWNRTCKPYEYVICSSMFTLGPHIVDVFIFYFYSVICCFIICNLKYETNPYQATSD